MCQRRSRDRGGENTPEEGRPWSSLIFPSSVEELSILQLLSNPRVFPTLYLGTVPHAVSCHMGSPHWKRGVCLHGEQLWGSAVLFPSLPSLESFSLQSFCLVNPIIPP